MSPSPASPPARESVVAHSPDERVSVRRSATHLTLRVDRLDPDGNPVHEELTLTTAAMTRAIEELLNVPRPSPHPPLAPRLSDPVLHRALRTRGVIGDARAVRRLHLLLGEADHEQTGFVAAQRALHRLAYLPLASRDPWGCWSDTLRGHGAQSYAALRLVAMAGYVHGLTIAGLEDHRSWLAPQHRHLTGTEPDAAAARADMMLRVVHVLAPHHTEWRDYARQLDLAERIRESPPRRPRELAFLTLRSLGFDGPKAHDFLKGARGSLRGWRWPLFGDRQTVAESDLPSDDEAPAREPRRAARRIFTSKNAGD